MVYECNGIRCKYKLSMMKSEKNDRENFRLIDSPSIADPSLRYVMVDSVHDDEISLLDIWLVLVKRRSLFLSLILLALLIGVSAALTLPVKYNYTTTLEIGGLSYDSQGKLVLVEPPSSVLAKLKQSYIPFVAHAYLQKNPGFEGVPVINAKLEKNSNIILIDISGIEKYRNIYVQLLNSIVDQVKQDHKRISLLKVKDLELSQYKLKNQVGVLKNEEQLIQSQIRRVDKKELLLKARIKETRYQLKISSQAKKNVAGAKGDEKALSLLMVDNDIRSMRSVLADLEEELQITLENSREEISVKLTENQQMQAQTNISIQKLAVELDNLLETRAITEPMQSIKPVGVGKKLIVIIALLAGMFIGLFAVFFAEFLSKARQRSAEQ